MAPSVRVERVIRATADRIFRAWTETSQLTQWFASEGFTVANAHADVQPGGRFRVVMRAPDGSEHAATGSYQRVEEPTLLTFSWRWESAPPEEADTLVTVELTTEGDATRLVLLHTGFRSEAEQKEHEASWRSCVERLVTLTEGE